MYKLITFILLLLTSSQVLAATRTSFLDVDLRQNRYLGETRSANQSSNYTLLSGDLNVEAQTEGFNFKLNPVAQGAVESSEEFYFGVPEAFVQPRKIASWMNLTIGRQKRTWSRLDEEFNLGVWQPQLRWDYLAPVQQGLTGVFFDWDVSRQLRLTFFTSPVAIPDQGPSYRLSNGQFQSSNRWFEQPHSRLSFQGTRQSKEAPLYFKLDKPSEEEIIMHPSFGLGVHYKSESPFFAQANYAYKPRNQIHLGLECDACGNLGGPQPLEVTAIIHPKIVNHHVFTLETGFERIDDSGWISGIVDVPNDSGFPEAYQEAPLTPVFIAGVGYQHHIGELIGRPALMRYSYMKAFELKSESKGSLVEDDQVQSSLDRYPFQELFATELRIQLTRSKRNLWNLNNRLNYSIPEQGSWLSSSISWSQGPMTLMLGMDILGATVDPNSEKAGLFSNYRANDRFFGGLNYVF